MKFSRQEYWSGWLFPSPGNLWDQGIEPGSPALQAGSLPSEPLSRWEKEKRKGISCWDPLRDAEIASRLGRSDIQKPRDHNPEKISINQGVQQG